MRFDLLPQDRGLLPGSVRFAGRVTAAAGADGTIWVDVPEEVAGDVVDRLDGWLLWLLPHAFETQQELVLAGPVDAELLDNSRALMEVWARWRRDRRPVAVRAEAVDVSPAASAPDRISDRSALFFTAGVDSFFTLFHHDEATRAQPAGKERPVDDLVYVWGFDIPLSQAAAFEAKTKTLAHIAGDTGKTLMTLVTNLRDTGVEQDWGAVMHGPALGGVGLLLGRRWHTALLSASLTRDDTHPWGSTPITDPLLSTGATRTQSYGEDHDRFEKLAYIVRFPLVLETLHVCWQERSDVNCGRCEKCFRTLLSLDILGVRDRATTFPREPLELGRLSLLWKDEPLVVQMYEQLKPHATAAGREDIVEAIDACLQRPRFPA